MATLREKSKDAIVAVGWKEVEGAGARRGWELTQRGAHKLSEGD